MNLSRSVLAIALAAMSLGGAALPSSASADADAETTIRARLVSVTDGLEFPVFVTDAGDGSGRLFAPEKAGRIRIISPDGDLMVEPFLDISDRVRSDFSEQGLLGLAFHPDFSSNGLFYVDYTRQPDGATVISEFAADGDLADATSERTVIVVPQPGPAHNAGMITFDRDGRLLASFGDGSFDAAERADPQDPTVPYGKIIALDVNAPEAYELDEFGQAKPGSATPQILAKGLRNPWRFSIDRELGHLYIGDVGLFSWEEINVLPAGAGMIDFGWTSMEGPQCGPDAACDPAAYQAPVIAYSHAPNGSVIGGYAYRGSAEPLLDGLYIFGDFSSSQILAASTEAMLEGAAVPVELLDRVPGGVVSFGEDEDGELYLVTTNGIARISAELVTTQLPPQPLPLPRLPVAISRPIDISDVVFRIAVGDPLEPRAPQVLSSNDLELSDGPNGCLTVEPSANDPFLKIPLPSGTGLRIEPGSEGPVDLFLLEGDRISDGQSMRVEVTAQAYEIFAPPRPADDPSIVRIDPPSSAASVICLVNISG